MFLNPDITASLGFIMILKRFPVLAATLASLAVFAAPPANATTISLSITGDVTLTHDGDGSLYTFGFEASNLLVDLSYGTDGSRILSLAPDAPATFEEREIFTGTIRSSGATQLEAAAEYRGPEHRESWRLLLAFTAADFDAIHGAYNGSMFDTLATATWGQYTLDRFYDYDYDNPVTATYVSTGPFDLRLSGQVLDSGLVAPVPLPAGLPLSGAALTALVAIARRRAA